MLMQKISRSRSLAHQAQSDDDARIVCVPPRSESGGARPEQVHPDGAGGDAAVLGAEHHGGPAADGGGARCEQSRDLKKP